MDKMSNFVELKLKEARIDHWEEYSELLENEEEVI
jgi:hypothetical protein